MDPNPAVAHALDVLQLLARHTEPLPAAAIARDLGLPRSSTYRILMTLADRGFVSHLRESGRFGLGAAAYELGSAYRRQAPLQQAINARTDGKRLGTFIADRLNGRLKKAVS